MPGGNTRSVLHVDPFPLTFVKGEGAIVRPVSFIYTRMNDSHFISTQATDADGHSYVDL